MKNLIKTILILLVILFGSLALTQDIQAQEYSDLKIEICYDSDLEDCETLDDENHPPLFEETNFLPGDEISSWIKITNLTDSSKSVAIEAINFGGIPISSEDLSNALEVKIKEGENSLYGGSEIKTLSEFYEYGEMYLSDVDVVESAVYEFKVKFPEDKGNNWKEKTTNFDVIIGVKGEGGNQTNGSNGGGGGTTLPPGMTITGESSEVGTDCESAEITWQTSYFSTGRVIYSADGKSHTLDLNDTGDSLPLYGYASTTDEITNKKTSHTIYLDNLKDNTTYHYRCISHASPATISKEFSFKTCECEGEEEEDSTPIETDEETGSPISFVPETEEESIPTEETPTEEIRRGEESAEETTTKTTEETNGAEEDNSINRGALTAAIGNMFNNLNFTLCDLWFILFILLLIYTIYRFIKDRKRRN